MIEKMKNIIRGNDLCVLATFSDGEPHCSLMTYITDDDCREIFMISHKETKKYSNLTVNPMISLLIDTREEQGSQNRVDIKALTVTGEFQTIKDKNKKDIVHVQFRKKHPHLNEFLNDPGAEIFSIRIKSFQLLDGVKNAFFEKI